MNKLISILDINISTGTTLDSSRLSSNKQTSPPQHISKHNRRNNISPSRGLDLSNEGTWHIITSLNQPNPSPDDITPDQYHNGSNIVRKATAIYDFVPNLNTHPHEKVISKMPEIYSLANS